MTTTSKLPMAILLAFIALLWAPSKAMASAPWPVKTFTEEVDACAKTVNSPVPLQMKKQICRCALLKIEQFYAHDDYVQDRTRIDDSMAENKVVSACIKEHVR